MLLLLFIIVILESKKKVEKKVGRVWEGMGGTGGHPPKYS